LPHAPRATFTTNPRTPTVVSTLCHGGDDLIVSVGPGASSPPSDLFDHAPFGVLLVAGDGTVTYANPAAATILSAETPLTTGATLSTLLPPGWLRELSARGTAEEAEPGSAHMATVPGAILGTLHRLTSIPTPGGQLLTISEPLLRPAERLGAGPIPAAVDDRPSARQDVFAALIARSPDVAVRFDRDLRFRFVSESIRAFSDVEPGDLIGRSAEEVRFFAGDADDRYHRRIREALETGREVTHVATVTTDLGEFVLHGRLMPERDENGHVTGIITITRDMTALVRGHLEWADTEALNRSLLDSMPDQVMVVDRDGIVVSMNAAGRRLIGLGPDSPLGDERWTALWLEEAHPVIERAVAAARGGAVETVVTPGIPVAGGGRWWETVVAPVAAGDDPRGFVLLISRDITESYLANQALQISKGRFQRLYDSNVIGMVFLNLDGTVVAANRAYLTLTGLSQAEVAAGGVTMEMITPQRYWVKDRGAMEILSSIGVWEPYEKEIQRRDGTVVPILFGGAGTPGDIVDAIAYVVDLSPLRATEDRLHERERQLELLLSAGTLGLWWGNLSAGETHWTDEYRAIMHLPEDIEPSVDAWRRRVHPDDREMVEREFARSVSERAVFDLEYRLLHDDGSVRWVRSTGRTEYAPDGTPTRSIGLVTDVTDRASAERERVEALQRERDAQGIAVAAEAQFWSLFNGAAESILVADDGGRIIAANPGAEELLGYPERELTNLSIDDIAPRGHLLMGLAPREGQPSRVRSGEHDVLRRGGEVVQVESRSRAVRTADGAFSTTSRSGTSRSAACWSGSTRSRSTRSRTTSRTRWRRSGPRPSSCAAGPSGTSSTTPTWPRRWPASTAAWSG
jgi:PAS domain S-box-containing protein